MPNEPIDIDKLIAQAREKNLAGGWRYQEWIRMMADALAQLRAERDAAVEKLNRLRFRAAMEVK